MRPFSNLPVELFLLATTLLLASFLIGPSMQQQPGGTRFGGGGSGVLPRARGPASLTISVKHGKAAAAQGQLQTNSTALVLWCHAVDAQRFEASRRGAEAPVLPAQEIYFTHNGQIHSANMSQDSYNGTLIIEQPHIWHAGQWTCHIRTRDYGNVNGEITVYLRPVVFSNSSVRIDDIQGEKFRFEASGVTVLRGEDAQLECPVYGYPKPEIHWRRGIQDVVMDGRIRVENGTLLIANATYEDEGVYICKAVNMFGRRGATVDKRVQQSTVSIERRLRVKNELGWLLPLCIILLTLAILVLIIVLCEMRKRRKEQKQLLGNGDDE